VEDDDKKVQFEEIILLRECIMKIDEEIRIMIDNERDSFRKKIDYLKNTNSSIKTEMQMLWAALFGNFNSYLV